MLTSNHVRESLGSNILVILLRLASRIADQLNHWLETPDTIPRPTVKSVFLSRAGESASDGTGTLAYQEQYAEAKYLQ